MSLKKVGRKTSPMWIHFTAIDCNNARCNECSRTVSYRTSTSNLRKHLTTKHPHITIGSNEIINNYAEKNFENVAQEYEIECDTPEIIELEEEVVHITPNKVILPKKTVAFTNNKIKSPVPTPKKFKPNCISNVNNKSEMIQEAINILSNVSSVETIPESEDDEFSQFGNYLIAQLRQLPLINALQLQEKFQSLLTRERVSIMLKGTETNPAVNILQQHHCGKSSLSPQFCSNNHDQEEDSCQNIKISNVVSSHCQTQHEEIEISPSSPSKFESLSSME